jgi:hypothetical protein
MISLQKGAVSSGMGITIQRFIANFKVYFGLFRKLLESANGREPAIRAYPTLILGLRFPSRISGQQIQEPSQKTQVPVHLPESRFAAQNIA